MKKARITRLRKGRHWSGLRFRKVTGLLFAESIGKKYGVSRPWYQRVLLTLLRSRPVVRVTMLRNAIWRGVLISTSVYTGRINLKWKGSFAGSGSPTTQTRLQRSLVSEVVPYEGRERVGRAFPLGGRGVSVTCRSTRRVIWAHATVGWARETRDRWTTRIRLLMARIVSPLGRHQVQATREPAHEDRRRSLSPWLGSDSNLEGVPPASQTISPFMDAGIRAGRIGRVSSTVAQSFGVLARRLTEMVVTDRLRERGAWTLGTSDDESSGPAHRKPAGLGWQSEAESKVSPLRGEPLSPAVWAGLFSSANLETAPTVPSGVEGSTGFGGPGRAAPSMNLWSWKLPWLRRHTGESNGLNRLRGELRGSAPWARRFSSPKLDTASALPWMVEPRFRPPIHCLPRKTTPTAPDAPESPGRLGNPAENVSSTVVREIGWLALPKTETTLSSQARRKRPWLLRDDEARHGGGGAPSGAAPTFAAPLRSGARSLPSRFDSLPGRTALPMHSSPCKLRWSSRLDAVRKEGTGPGGIAPWTLTQTSVGPDAAIAHSSPLHRSLLEDAWLTLRVNREALSNWRLDAGDIGALRFGDTPSALSHFQRPAAKLALAKTSNGAVTEDSRKLLQILEKKLTVAETTTVATHQAAPPVDIRQLTDRVYEEMQRKIRIERERRGL